MEKVFSGNVDEILKSLEDGLRDYMDSDSYKAYLRAVSRFHDYSTNNVLLITMQKPDATLVAGYSTWKNAFHRYVKKGEKAIKIIAPMPAVVEKEQERTDEYGNVSIEKVRVTVPRFRAVNVFDISQTDGEPLPSIDPRELSADVGDYSCFLHALERSSRVPVRYIDIDGGAKGYYHAIQDRIFVQKGMSQAQTVKTLVHEMAHSYLHGRDGGGALTPQKTKEVEAESIAFSVCTHFGIDTSEYTFPYVSAWSNESDLKTLKSSMNTIRDTASMLIHRIEENYQIMTRENAAEKLAEDLIAFMKNYDFYQLNSCADDPHQATEQIKEQLIAGDTRAIQNNVREYMRDETDPDARNVMADLIGRVKEFEPEALPPEKKERGQER